MAEQTIASAIDLTGYDNDLRHMSVPGKVSKTYREEPIEQNVGGERFKVNAYDGVSLDAVWINPPGPLLPPWTEHTDKEMGLFYHNPETLASQFERPAQPPLSDPAAALQPAVLIFHGNMGNLDSRWETAKFYHRRGTVPQCTACAVNFTGVLLLCTHRLQRTRNHNAGLRRERGRRSGR